MGHLLSPVSVRPPKGTGTVGMASITSFVAPSQTAEDQNATGMTVHFTHERGTGQSDPVTLDLTAPEHDSSDLPAHKAYKLEEVTGSLPLQSPTYLTILHSPLSL